MDLATTGPTLPYRILKEIVLYHDVVWVPTEPLQLKIFKTYHDFSSSGHPEKFKTMELICQDYNWKGMTVDVENFVKYCMNCLCTKFHRQKP